VTGGSEASARPRRWAGSSEAVLACCTMLALLAPGPARAVSEYQVKAAFLLNFGKFVEWPESAPDDLEICVFGTDPFGSALDETVAGRSIGKRSVKTRRIQGLGSASRCSILFVGRSSLDSVDEIVSRLAGSPVLIVGEQARFAKRGGMINFIQVNQKIRFEINEAAARKAGLKISSQLLKLATIVEGG
jgi:hypothetical protein